MNKIKYLAIAVLTLCLSYALSGCKSSQPVPVAITDTKEIPKQTGVPAEVEVVFPCSGIDSDEDFIRVTGTGKSKDRTMAKDRAYQDALSHLADKLAGVSSMENMKVGVSTNADGEEFHDKQVTVSKRIAEANVSGYRTACEKFTMNTQDNSYNCYVLIEFGKQKIVKQMYDEASKEKMLRADYDFDRYMQDFDKDLKEYENTHKQ